MKRINQIIRNDRAEFADGGFTLVEVIVAMIVFSIIAVSVAGALINSLTITQTSRSRTVALNLASQDLDQARAVTDVFAVQSKTWTQTVQGTPYTVVRTVEWQSSATTATACGTGSGTLQYKVVRDVVTYPGSGTTPAVSSTILSPNSRINDPTLGTIVVAVSGASGSGVSGVAVNIVPAATNPNGATSVATPAVTDSNGCTYALKVTPGNYTVSISKANGIDINQAVTPSVTPVVVTAGTSSPLSFTYDTAAAVTLQYASNYTGTALLPSNLDMTFFSTTGGVDNMKLSNATSVNLFPFVSGYTYEAGAYVAPITGSATSCVNVDPGAWTKANSSGKVGTSFSATTASGSGNPVVKIPMGVVTLPAFSGTLAIQATSVNSSANGDPGCTTGIVYNYAATSGTPTIALPFGTWRITTGLGLLPVTVASNGIKTGGMVNSDGTVTLDPRGVTP